MTCGKFHVQSRGLFWFISTIYLVHTAFIGTKRPNDAVFSLVIFRPPIAGGNLTVPIDSSVRLVKCSRRETSHNTIRLRYGHGKDRKCIVMRAVDSLEREKWLVGLIQAMAAAGPPSAVPQISSEDASHTSDDTISSSADGSTVLQQCSRTDLPVGSLGSTSASSPPSATRLPRADDTEFHIYNMRRSIADEKRSTSGLKEV